MQNTPIQASPVQEDADQVEPLSARDYQSALDVQTACNLSGVVFSFARVMQRICDSEPSGTDARNTHAICQLYAEQIKYLAYSGFGPEGYSMAYEECVAKSESARSE